MCRRTYIAGTHLQLVRGFRFLGQLLHLRSGFLERCCRHLYSKLGTKGIYFDQIWTAKREEWSIQEHEMNDDTWKLGGAGVMVE